MNDRIIVDYIWIDGEGNLRSKNRVVNKFTNLPPLWNYDGSSTSQASTSSSEIILNPIKIVKCPFRKKNGYIALCESLLQDKSPAFNNNRNHCKTIFDKHDDNESWWGLEQEYFIYDVETNKSVGFDTSKKQGNYYCGVGAQYTFDIRRIVDAHLDACLYANINICGTNFEVAPGQCEYQIGVVPGIDVADQLWISRYILEKIAEQYNKYIIYDPKPLKGDWNGSGLHTNFSTKLMRENGISHMYNAIDKLCITHKDHMKYYGKNNQERMSGSYETSAYDLFSYEVANRNCSIRIPYDAINNINIYLEDRRPAANADPYLVCAKILETISQ